MTKKSALIVEDENLIAYDIQQTLKSYGFEEVEINKFAEKAYDSLARKNPDLVIIDIKLAGQMNGIELAKKIQDNFENISVIFITAYSGNSMRENAMKTRPIAYITKPYVEFELNKILEEFQK